MLINGNAFDGKGDIFGIACGLLSAVMYAFMVICNKKAKDIVGLENSTLQLNSSDICGIKARLRYADRTIEYSANSYTRSAEYGHWLLFLLFLYRQAESTDGCYLRIFGAIISSVVLGSVLKRNNATVADYRCGAYNRRSYVW